MTAATLPVRSPVEIADTALRIRKPRRTARTRQAWNTKCLARTCTTISRSFVVEEPSGNADTFIRWALLDDVRGLFVVSKIEFRGGMLALSADARAVLNNPNAGGSSALSEAISFECLRVQFGVRLCRTEMQIQYWTQSKITDYSIVIGAERIGVSVTRACVFKGEFTNEMARRLLVKKLSGVLDSSAHVITPHAWKRQVLHIWCQFAYVADVLRNVYEQLDVALRRDTLVICTVCPGAQWMFFASTNAPEIVDNK